MTLKSDRTSVKRLPERGDYDRDTVYDILDEAHVCHVGIVRDGTSIVIPTLHVRVGEHLILHGSPASAMLRTAATQEICVTVTIVDAFVLARSAFHHSMNYRSVTILGEPELVPENEKVAALDALVEKMVPKRIPSLRPMTEKEVKGTKVLRLDITEASAKIRTGMPIDDEDDYELPIWAGIIPASTTYGEPVVDPAMRMDVPIPDHVSSFQ